MAKRAVFLDRDGVLTVEASYPYTSEQITLLPDAAKAVRRLNEAGLFCCLISNQSGLAKNDYTVSQVETLHKRLRRLLKKEAGAKLDAIYYCPYLSPIDGGVNPQLSRWSTWRKPNTGMLVAAAWEHGLDLKTSFLIGDKATDIDLAHNAGLKGILVKTGYGDQVLRGTFQHSTRPDHIAIHLGEAVAWLLSQ